MSDTLVIIPTYNERENVANIIQAVMTLDEPFDVLIVDDNSPDKTAHIVKELQQAAYPDRLHLLERPGKQGLGTAYIAGFEWALARDYEYIMEMDADFSHDPADLPRLRAACATDGADMSVGSRYTRGGKVTNWPLDRIILSYGASVYVRMITLMPIKDPTAGFVCYTRRVLSTLALDRIKFIGYAFQIEMKYATWKLGFKIKEVPITFTDRKEGISKMSKGIVQEAVGGVFKMRFSRTRKMYRRAELEEQA